MEALRDELIARIERMLRIRPNNRRWSMWRRLRVEDIRRLCYAIEVAMQDRGIEHGLASNMR